VKIDLLLRAQYVKRFHIVHTLKHQSIAEHSFNVAMIAGLISERMEFDKKVTEQVTLAALFHDMDEVITGDIPTPTKIRAKAQGVDLNDNGILVPHQNKGSLINRIVKVADYIEAITFLDINGIGMHACSVEADIAEKMEEYVNHENRFSQGQKEIINDVRWEITSGGFLVDSRE